MAWFNVPFLNPFAWASRRVIVTDPPHDGFNARERGDHFEGVRGTHFEVVRERNFDALSRGRGWDAVRADTFD